MPHQISSLVWQATEAIDKPVSIIPIDFGIDTVWQIVPKGTYAQRGDQLDARGVTIDNTTSAANCYVTVNSQRFTVLSFQRVTIEFATRNVQAVKIEGDALFDCVATFWVDRSVIGPDITDVYAITVASLSTFLPSYSATIPLTPLDPAPTDIFTFTGIAGKAISINRVQLNLYSATPAVPVEFQFIIRSGANAGGTFTTPLCVPLDPAQDPAGAVVRAYTVNPAALGASRGPIYTDQANITAATPISRFTRDLNTRSARPVVFHSSDILAINMAGVAFAGGQYSANIDWYELPL